MSYKGSKWKGIAPGIKFKSFFHEIQIDTLIGLELKSVFLVKSEMKIEQNYQDILTSIKNIS